MSEARAAARVEAIIVHYGDWTPTRAAIASVSRSDPDVPIIVVDNGGADGTPPDGVRCIRAGRNAGYGAAGNLGARESRADSLLFLNNDVELAPGAIGALAAALEREPRVAAVAPRLLGPNGRPTRSIGRAPTPRRVLFEGLFLPRIFPCLPFFHGHHTAFLSHGRARDVETLSGAAFLVRRQAFEQVGGFDEAFFFYAEESDLFARLIRAGWRIRFDPAAEATHHGGVASRAVPRGDLDRRLAEGLSLYALLHHGERGERRTRRALRAGARLRWLLAHFRAGAAGRARRERYAELLRALASR